MQVASFSGCKVYNLSAGKTFPQWISESKKRALAKDEDYRRRLELIQDFEMSTASQCIKISPDREHVILTGTYPPCVRCYTVSDLALKFQRGLTCEVVDFEILSEDYGKLVFLQADRTIAFHAPYGSHYSVRVPKFGRTISYQANTCDLFVGSAGDEIYRLNLEIGKFREPYKLDFNGCNKMHLNPMHQLLACGGESSCCQFFDPRMKKTVALLNIYGDVDVTALKFDLDGLTLGIGTSSGICYIYDIRSSKPVLTKEHQYGEPIVDISFHNSSRHILSTDKKLIKIWQRDEPNQGKVMTNIETPADINNVAIVQDRRGESGMIFAAGEQSKVMTYFVPQLGPAPSWCSFLESLTEELEESASQSVYADFKFISRQDVEELGATSLIGTPMLKSYMHGYFMDMKLYLKLRAVSKPFEYEEYRKKAIQNKIDQKRETRIAPRRRVNMKTVATSDARFSKLSREEFQIDKNSEEYRLRHPVIASNRYQEDEDNLEVSASLNDDAESHNSSHENDYESVDVDEDDQILLASKRIKNTKRNPKMFEYSGSSKDNSLFADPSLIQARRQERKLKMSTTLDQRLNDSIAKSHVNRTEIRTLKGSAEDGGIVREISFIPREPVNNGSRQQLLTSGKIRKEEAESLATFDIGIPSKKSIKGRKT